MATMRSSGSATISFGLVTVPVKLYAASTERENITFNQLAKATGNRLRQQMIDEGTGQVCDNDDRIKGYEFSKGQYVTFTDAELKAIEAVGDQVIAIREFVPADSVSPIHFEKPYFLAPDGKAAARAYRLLRDALRSTELVAIGTYAARGKDNVLMLSVEGDGILAQYLRFSHEVRSMADVPDIGGGDSAPAEVALAVQLVESLRRPSFNPSVYTDSVRERVLAMIQAKVDGQPIVAPAAPAAAKAVDLMEALRASLNPTPAAA